MSFSSEQKCRIIQEQIKTNCCKKAFLTGVILSRGSIVDGEVEVRLESRPIAEYISLILLQSFTKETEISTLPGGGRGYRVKFSSRSLEKALEEFLLGGSPFSEKCPQCLSHYLRGIFVGAGRITDPTKQYLLEFAPKNDVDRFVEYFDELGLNPKLSVKPRERVIYFNNSTSIEDFLALAQMNDAAFALMNAKIQGELRNSANRVANCEMNNINKAVSASAEQITVISELVETGLISQLPDELKMTAELRLLHSDLSLSQLASLITPYISKPGLSHRLKRINEIGKELLERWHKRQ